MVLLQRKGDSSPGLPFQGPPVQSRCPFHSTCKATSYGRDVSRPAPSSVPVRRDMSLQYFRCFMASLALVLGSKLTLACSPCAKAQFGSVQPSANAFTNSSELLKACTAWDSALRTHMAGEMQGPTTGQLNCRKMSRKENELSETSPIVHATGLAG